MNTVVNPELRKTLNQTTWTLLATLCLSAPANVAMAESHYTEPQIYQSRPKPEREMPFGTIGTTGVMVRIYQNVTLKVESTMPGSPAVKTESQPQPEAKAVDRRRLPSFNAPPSTCSSTRHPSRAPLSALWNNQS